MVYGEPVSMTTVAASVASFWDPSLVTADLEKIIDFFRIDGKLLHFFMLTVPNKYFMLMVKINGLRCNVLSSGWFWIKSSYSVLSASQNSDYIKVWEQFSLIVVKPKQRDYTTDARGKMYQSQL